MKKIEFDVDLTTKELYRFSMRHTYFSLSGVLGLFISLGSWAMCALRYWELEPLAVGALIVLGFLFTVVQPLMLYSKAAAQKKRSEDINAALHYCMGEEGITVSQGQQEVVIKWYEIRRRVRTASAVYLYMSPVRAFIFPKEQLGENYEDACHMIDERMEAYKEYEPEQDVQEEESGGQPVSEQEEHSEQREGE